MTEIKTIGVCGAGTMGSQLAAFFASAGFDVLLFDLKQELSEGGLEGALKAKPAAFFDKKFAKRVTPLNYEEHLDRFADCDWVIEAIAERLDWKHDLYGKIQPLLKPEAILSSNTSGLPLSSLVEPLDLELRQRFLITHFFNPPRYMKLVEVVLGEDTTPEVFAKMKSFLSETLGKGVVEAKDTPNFIANRIGTFGMMQVLKTTQEMRLSVEQVDAISGPVMGRPKSATFRTADLVGLDVLAAVATTAYERCLEDERRDMYEIPPVLATLLEKKWLGQKTKGGFYKKEDKEIFALDLQTLEYAPKTKPRMDGIGVARRYTDLGKRLSALVYNPDTAGKFAWEVTIGTLAYAANRVGEIADDIVQIDQAMRWGFAWDMGPFEIWDAIGLEKSVRRMKAEGKPIPAMVEELLATGQTSFYGRDTAGSPLYFDRNLGSPESIREEPGTIVLANQKAEGKEILRNWSASLVDLDDGVACIEFHSALQPDFNPIDGAIIDILGQSLHYAKEQGLKGLVISHDGTHFCAGANLALILELAKRKKFDLIDQVSKTSAGHHPVHQVRTVPGCRSPLQHDSGRWLRDGRAVQSDRRPGRALLWCGGSGCRPDTGRGRQPAGVEPFHRKDASQEARTDDGGAKGLRDHRFRQDLEVRTRCQEARLPARGQPHRAVPATSGRDGQEGGPGYGARLCATGTTGVRTTRQGWATRHQDRHHRLSHVGQDLQARCPHRQGSRACAHWRQSRQRQHARR